MRNADIAAVILAAGCGSRMDGDVPKQYRLLGGVPVLRRTLATLLNAKPAFSKIVVAIDEAHRLFYMQAVDGLEISRLQVVTGGATRQCSVHAALRSLAAMPPAHVILHDAARPFVTQQHISNVLAVLRDAKAAICAAPVTDTLKRSENGTVTTTIDRAHVYAAQTPQAFDFAALLAAHDAGVAAQRDDFTDDAMLMEWQGHKVRLIESSADNFKLTTREDFERAEKLFYGGTMKSALGYDVHALKEGDHVMLGGVKIPHVRGIDAHSDGDVVLHALADAVFGLAGDGDIGTHFPPSDMTWRGAASSHFVAAAMETLHAKGGFLSHCDVTLIAEAPKIADHRAAIVASLSGLTGLPQASIGLKATTGEGLGFIGRGEGIAAFVMLSARF